MAQAPSHAEHAALLDLAGKVAGDGSGGSAAGGGGAAPQAQLLQAACLLLLRASPRQPPAAGPGTGEGLTGEGGGASQADGDTAEWDEIVQHASVRCEAADALALSFGGEGWVGPGPLAGHDVELLRSAMLGQPPGVPERRVRLLASRGLLLRALAAGGDEVAGAEQEGVLRLAHAVLGVEVVGADRQEVISRALQRVEQALAE